jgi:hypothetical protein
MTTEEFEAVLCSRGAGDQAVRDTVEMLAAHDACIYDTDWATATIAATDFRTWCQEVLKPAAQQGDAV